MHSRGMVVSSILERGVSKCTKQRDLKAANNVMLCEVIIHLLPRVIPRGRCSRHFWRTLK